MFSSFSITLATKADIDAMAEVSLTSGNAELGLLMHSWYPDKETSGQLRRKISKLSFSNNIDDPKMRVFKAISKTTGQVVAACTMKYEQGNLENPRDNSRSVSIPGINHEMARIYWNSELEKKNKCLDGQRHIVP